MYNRGKFSPRSWEGTTYNGAKPDEDTDMGLDSVDLLEEGELIVDVHNDTDSSQSDEAQHQVNVTSQRYECQSVPITANR